MKILVAIVMGVSVFVSGGVRGDTPPSKQDSSVTLQLGTVTVKGRKQVLRALQAIKIGLRTPISGSKKDRNKIVCRIHKAIGSHLQQILTCAPNWHLTQMRMEWQTALMVGQSTIPSVPEAIQAQEVLNSLTTPQSEREFSLGINPGFVSALDRLPDLAPAAATAHVPADAKHGKH